MIKVLYKSTLMAVLGCLLLLPTACNDSFLEIVPDDVVPFGEFWETPAHAQEVLNGAYDAMSFGSVMGGQAFLLAELFADNLAENPVTLNGDWAAHYTRTTDIFLGTTRTFMHDANKAIARANFVIDNIDQIEGMPQDDATRIINEAKFIRGVLHFELVRIFAQPFGYTADNSHLGIPIRVTYGKDILPRSTVGEVYNQVIADLTDAANNLPATNSVYATKWAANGYLAKVYFQMNDFANAYDRADMVIENSGATFDSTLTSRFSMLGTSEAVFQLVSSPVDNAGGFIWDNYRRNPASQNTAAVTLSSSYAGLATADPTDKRGSLWVQVDGSFNYCLKVEDVQQTNVPLVHLTELKLIRAESAAEQGSNLAVAVGDLNDIRTRAGLLEISANSTAMTIIATARQERRLELVIEGNRLHELKRQAVHDSPNLTIRGAAWDCPGLVAQIPDSELKGNLDMVPNEEGGCQ